MDNEQINYKGVEYSIERDEENNRYICRNNDKEFAITKEELEVLSIVAKKKDNKTEIKDLVSIYNDMIDFNPYQYKPYFRLISKENEKKCVYIADEVGVGKTFETGIIISELLYSDKVSKEESILIVCPNMLCRKWQEVLNVYFGLPSRIIKNFIQINGGISIISYNSISRLNQDEMIENIKFGILIIDEAHNIGKRYDKLFELRKKSTYTILLSATPLSGKDNNEHTQKSVLFGSEKIEKSLFISESAYFNRTLKEEMRQEQVNWHIENYSIKNINLEKYINITENIFSGKNTLRKFWGLNMIGSSPAAARAYCNYLVQLDSEKIKELFIESKLVKEDYIDWGYDTIEELLNSYNDLEEILLQITEEINKLSLNISNASQDDKLEKLKKIIVQRQMKAISGQEDSSYYKKLVIFVNYNDTAKYLNDNIDGSVLINGSIDTEEKLSRFMEFKNMSSGKDILIITNVACEGLDMDFCNAIVNYDLTYNPVQLAQRKGRIDRFQITCIDKYIYNFINEGVDPDCNMINQFVINDEKESNFSLEYNNSIYPILLRKLKKIKEETSVYYNVIDSIGKTYENKEKENKSKKEARDTVVELFNKFDTDNVMNFNSIEDICSYYEKKHNKAYDKINMLLKEKHICVTVKEDKVVIEVDKNNRDFLKYVYDGGTINSHLIFNK